MEVYKLKKPDTVNGRDKVRDLILHGPGVGSIAEYVVDTNYPHYLFWDKVKHKPRPKGMTPEEFWSLVKFVRQNSGNRTITPIRDERGEFFSWQPLPEQDYFLHEIDMNFGGRLMSQKIEDPASRQRYIARGIMEEAIASSQLEGANTTRRVAKRMLLEKREPVSKSERMIVNNYNTMLVIEDELKDKSLSRDVLLDLHVSLTNDTMEGTQVGRFRKNSDDVVVCDRATNVIYHIPPSEEFLHKDIDRLIRYFNDSLEKDRFVHPVIKAIFLHFWVAHLHPFTDGNGRMARNIFYWYLLKKGYWAFSYLPISRVIKKSPGQYRDAYVYTEQDDNDLTYFLDYNFHKIKQARKEFESYLKRKETENRKMAAIAREEYDLNDRQIQLLRYLHRNSGAITSIKTHSEVYGISRPTSRKDLEELEGLGLLSSRKVGRERPFRGTKEISRLFQ